MSQPTQAQLDLAALAGSSSPRTMRALRKIQSHQILSSRTSAFSGPTSHLSTARSSVNAEAQQAHLDSPVRLRHRRARSNSDAGSGERPILQAQKRSGRKTGSGFGIKRSVLETLLRDGPQNGDVEDALKELRYLVLSTRVEADGDGMVCGRCNSAVTSRRRMGLPC